jgi:putative copper export protein
VRAPLERCSRLGTLAVALILASGLLSAALRMQGSASLLQTTYGNVLWCKIALIAVLLALAAANHFIFLARLRRPGDQHSFMPCRGRCCRAAHRRQHCGACHGLKFAGACQLR